MKSKLSTSCSPVLNIGGTHTHLHHRQMYIHLHHTHICSSLARRDKEERGREKKYRDTECLP